MALSNLFGWNTKKETAAAAACGTACGAGDKPEEKPAACLWNCLRSWRQVRSGICENL